MTQLNWNGAEYGNEPKKGSILESVEEIIAGEEVDRSTPAEVIAGIESAMQEITNLRQLTNTQAGIIIDLQTRIDTMLEYARGMHKTTERNAITVTEILTQAGSHNDRNQAVIGVVNRLMHLISGQKWQLARLEEVALPPEARSRDNDDTIPF